MGTERIEKVRNRKVKKKCIVFVIISLGMFLSFVMLFVRDRNEDYQSAEKFAGQADVMVPFQKVEIITNNTFDISGGVTCTGLAYDVGRELFYIGNYGKTYPEDVEQKISILVCDRDFQIIGVIPIQSSYTNMQGVTYSARTDSLFFADTERVTEIDMTGKLLRQINCKEFVKYHPNAVLYDDRDDSLWILCEEKYLIHIDIRTGGLINKIKCSFLGQDQICFDEDYNILFSVGMDYNGDKNYLGKIDTESGEVTILYKLIDSYALEGIFKSDGVLYVVNDGIYHRAKIKENYIAEYRIKK